MKNLRLVCAALAFVLAGAWAVTAHACDKHKTQATTAANAHGECTAEMAANCTPEMRAACMAGKGAKAKGAKGASFTTASAGGQCGAKGATMTTASAGDACGAKGAKGATFTTASTVAAGSGDGCCAMKGATAAKSAKATKVHAVAAGAGCSAHDAKGVTAYAAGAGGSCSSHGAKGAMAKGAHDCDACDDLAMCGPDGLLNEGATIQTVALKNGVMLVYTAGNPGQVSAIQSAMHRRGERLAKLVTAGDKASLCGGCKDFRGAMASGKLQREVVNIEGGTLVLMTSSDPAMVKKIRTMADASKTAAQVKS